MEQDKSRIGRTLAIVSIVFVAANFAWDIYRDSVSDDRIERLDNLEYQLAAIEHQPFLKMVGLPSVEGVWLRGKVFTRSSLLVPGKWNSVNDTAVFRELDSVTIAFQIVNQSEYPARVLLEALADSVSFAPIIRSILSAPLNQEKSETAYSEQIQEIAPHDTEKVVHTTRIFAGTGRSFTVHFALVYENSLGQLFDSYFWIKATKKPSRMWREFRDSSGVKQTRIVRDPPTVTDLITFDSPVVDSYRVLSKEEAEKLRTEFNLW